MNTPKVTPDDSRTAPTVAPEPHIHGPLSLLPWEERDDRIFDLTGLVVEGEEGICEPRDRAFVVHACNAFQAMYDALKHAENHCPCGARPESPRTHPHIGGCPIGDAIAKAEGR